MQELYRNARWKWKGVTGEAMLDNKENGTSKIRDGTKIEILRCKEKDIFS